MRYGTIFFPDQKIQSYNNTQQKNNNIWTHSSSFVSLYVSSSWVLVFIVIVLFRFTSLECWLWRVGNNSIDFQSQVLLRIAHNEHFFSLTHLLFSWTWPLNITKNMYSCCTQHNTVHQTVYTQSQCDQCAHGECIIVCLKLCYIMSEQA